jgi:hypothetical protein
MNLKYKIFFFIFCLPIFWHGCQCNQRKDQHFEIPVPEEPLQLQTLRLDSLIFNTPFISAEQYQSVVTKKSENCICSLLEDVLRMGPCEDSNTFKKLHEFTIFKDITDLQRAIESTFKNEDLKAQEQSLAVAFQRLKTLLPKEETPKIVWINGALAAACYAQKDELYIGLDSYLYPHPIVQEFPPDFFPLYKRKNMQAQYLVPNAIFNWMSYRSSQYDSLPPEKNDFLSSLIYSGKIMYATDLLLPNIPDSVKMMWAEEEIKWAQEHEFQIWKEIAQQEVMFGTKKNEILKWFNEAPHTFAGNIPAESPPQLGIWIGWQIVKAYMSKNESITLESLLRERNHQKILSAYKPSLP